FGSGGYGYSALAGDRGCSRTGAALPRRGYRCLQEGYAILIKHRSGRRGRHQSSYDHSQLRALVEVCAQALLQRAVRSVSRLLCYPSHPPTEGSSPASHQDFPAHFPESISFLQSSIPLHSQEVVPVSYSVHFHSWEPPSGVANI